MFYKTKAVQRNKSLAETRLFYLLIVHVLPFGFHPHIFLRKKRKERSKEKRRKNTLILSFLLLNII
jgi:hypothetical protein